MAHLDYQVKDSEPLSTVLFCVSADNHAFFAIPDHELEEMPFLLWDIVVLIVLLANLTNLMYLDSVDFVESQLFAIALLLRMLDEQELILEV